MLLKDLIRSYDITRDPCVNWSWAAESATIPYVEYSISNRTVSVSLNHYYCLLQVTGGRSIWLYLQLQVTVKVTVYSSGLKWQKAEWSLETKSITWGIVYCIARFTKLSDWTDGQPPQFWRNVIQNESSTSIKWTFGYQQSQSKSLRLNTCHLEKARFVPFARPRLIFCPWSFKRLCKWLCDRPNLKMCKGDFWKGNNAGWWEGTKL